MRRCYGDGKVNNSIMRWLRRDCAVARCRQLLDANADNVGNRKALAACKGGCIMHEPESILWWD